MGFSLGFLVGRFLPISFAPTTPAARFWVVLFDLRQPHHGTIFVRNTEKRRSEPCEVSKNILNAGRLSPKESERLRGRLQFSAGQLFGGRAKASLHTLAKHSRQQAYALSQEVSEACPQLLEMLEDGAKGEISSA